MTALNKQALNEGQIEWLKKLADMEYCKSNPGHWLMSLRGTNMLAKLSLRSAELLSELEAAEKRIAELESRTPYGYLRQCDGQIQISIGSEQPHNRSGGYATPWFAIYTAAAGKGEAS
ncbi:hypothetical protein [Enterobacter asburiae]|uniref:hypothetical protein n=1 Tax=Enterobacter asburiae TaxID=61645 RepID=UPI000A6D5EAA|nr:hypothetical protein [Enterobacter asburiae]